MSACGLDFGTSNTTLGLAGDAGPRLVALEGNAVTVPSSVFYHRNGGYDLGRAAIAAYVDGEDGRLMRSLKSVLGSSLIDETTLVGRQRLKFREVIGSFIGAVKKRAEAETGARLAQVVHGRPVHFVDNDPAADARAEEVLRALALGAGFEDVSFQYEPIAAALDYELQVAGEELALIADIGGGTSDFSIVRIGPQRARRPDRTEDILANDGIRIGGVDFDRKLSLEEVMPLLGFRSAMKRPGVNVPNGYFHDLATWSAINRLYEPKVLRDLGELERDCAEPKKIGRLLHVIEEQRGHTLALDVENAKIALAETESTVIDLEWIEKGLSRALTQPAMFEDTRELAAAIGRRIDDCLALAGIGREAIDAVFLTGGSTRLAHVHAAILGAVPEARAVEGDTFGSVGTGLAIEAARRYGPAENKRGVQARC
ncbi:Heat shock protein 70 [Hartmannibacter diazotrophicus]|uniref:Heat shock protein 70 n=1 Tax=Hartmannibacter diazotrophicus TaxID=1482074 RepID=A0A2C9D2Z3_9HYPH|nr:Hsp70 family protein [Hartmannibacter diazotrophicus]SON54528.1 Heat shock protein 70 [Hartmannibacter diazotrophicus]